MPTLDVNPTYSSNTLLTEAQLDSIRTPIHTFVNTTKLDSVNVNIQDVVDNLTADEASIVISKKGVGTVTADGPDTTDNLTTAYANISSVTAVTTGTYLVTASGFCNLTDQSSFATLTEVLLYYRVYNETASIAIGPEVLVYVYFDGNVSPITTGFNFPKSIQWAYITTLTAGDAVKFQSYRINKLNFVVSSPGTDFSDIKNLKLNILRLA